MTLFDATCIVIAAAIFAFWGWCMLRCASENDAWWEHRERETAARIAENDAWLKEQGR